MSNLVLTAKNAPGVTAKLVAAHLKEKAKFIKSIAKEDDSTFRDQYKSASPSDTVYVKKPTNFTVGSNLDITSTIQDIKQEKVALKLDKLANVAFKMDSLEMAYDKPVKYWNDEFVEPAMNALAAEMDRWALEKAARYTANLVGTAGVQSGAIRQFLEAGEKIYQNLAPEDDKLYAMINPATNTATVDARKGLFQKSDLIAAQYANGYIGQGEGFTYVRSNLLPTFTNGADVTGIAVEASVVAIANGMSTLGVDGVTSSATIKAGTVFTISGVYDVHPLTKQALPTLKQFTVLEDVTETSGNSVTLSISPAIYYTSGDPRQNVSAAPVDESGALTFFGAASTAYAQNLCFHKDAFRFVSVPLYLPKNMDFAAQETVDGIAVRAIRGFDIKTSESIMRFDILAGLAAVRPEWACRATG
ncbi:MAG: hypothetical protein EOM21_19400 [Gammaproteobacteria bacterium]|nr:hypothetical protein [Gammaproteobacteria bacterium]